MSLELPNEVWTNILKRVEKAGDWGRLQQVSHAFNAVLQAECWTQAKELNLKIIYSGVDLEVNGKGWLGLSDTKLLLFAKELAKKATKIQSVSLKIYGKTLRPEDAGGVVLNYLAAASLQIKKLDLHMDLCVSLSAVPPLADFVSSVSGTLETLSILTGPINCHELHEAFRRCRALKTIAVSVGDPGMVESLLCGKTQIQTVQMIRGLEPAHTTASALLNTGAQLTTCHFGRHGHSVFEAYTQAVQERNLIADHPLKTVKNLTFDDPPGGLSAIHQFPDLEELGLLLFRIDIDILNTVVAQFLEHYRDSSGNRRLLKIKMRAINGLPPLAAMVEQMVSRVTSAEKKGRTQELTFIRGNATAIAFIMDSQFR